MGVTSKPSSCFALKVAESAFFEELFVGLLSGFDVGFAELEHAIKQAGEFVGPGVEKRNRSWEVSEVLCLGPVYFSSFRLDFARAR